MDTPLHPLFVHFPIVCLLLAAVFFSLELFTRKEPHKNFAVILMLIGVAGAAIAVITGNNEHGSLRVPHEVHEMMETHELLGYVVLWFYGAMAVWGFLRRKATVRWEKILFSLLFWLGLGVVVYTSHIGGEMVYVKGAGVEPLKKEMEATWKQERLERGAIIPHEDGDD